MLDLESVKTYSAGELPAGSFNFAPVFRSGAVLQRNMPLTLWGDAAAGTRLRCTLDGCQAETVADENGRFQLTLPPQSAGTDKKLRLTDVNSGVTVVSENIAIGEVYLAAGQSNIEFALRRANGWEQEQQKVADPELRFFHAAVTTFPGRQSETGGVWQSSAAESAADFSAIGYYFGKTLRQKTRVPVGIIGTYKGGVPIETFMSREALLQDSYFGADTAGYHPQLPPDGTLPDGNAKLMRRIAEKFAAEPEKRGEKLLWHTGNYDDSAWETVDLPDNWTLAGYNHAGSFWYRKTVELPPSWAGREVTIGIGAADKADETFFNGEKIGATGDFRKFDHWNVPRIYTVPAPLVKSGRNTIAVRVMSAASICGDGGLIGPETAMFLRCGDEVLPLAGEWKLKLEHDFGTAGMECMRTLGAGVPSSLHMLFDNIIAPLIPVAMRGVLWYQGEANAICQAREYRRLLNTLIADWRRLWQRELEFIIIQLPGFQRVHAYSEFSQWAILRNAQRQAAQESNALLAVTVKYGDVNDIHPPDKRPVGEICGVIAAEKIQAPRPLDCRCDGAVLTVLFDGDIRDTVPQTLMLAGSDGRFYPAGGRIVNGTKLQVFAPQVAAPVTLRYGWSDNPQDANLYGSNGLQVSPFEISSAKR